MFTNDELIFAYTRRQAIEDGVLVDVTETATEAGFVLPVAVTAGRLVRLHPPPRRNERTGRGRAALGRAHDAPLRDTEGERREPGRFRRARAERQHGTPPLVRLYAVCGPGDEAEPSSP